MTILQINRLISLRDNYFLMILDGIWILSSASNEFSNLKMTIPGDIHSCLMENNIIPDPFNQCNEESQKWVALTEWIITRKFNVGINIYETLEMESVDTFAIVYINGKEVGQTSNHFMKYVFDVSKYLHTGENLIEIKFLSAPIIAKKRADSLPNPVPWSVGNNQFPHMNLIRKPQFHSGWDWGPCICPIGIYSTIHLKNKCNIELQYTKINTLITNEKAIIEFIVGYQSISYESEPFVFFFNNEHKHVYSYIQTKGNHDVKCIFEVENPCLWNTHDRGIPFLYDMVVRVGQSKMSKKIGIRSIEFNRQLDIYGESFEMVLNGQVLYCKGANIIPYSIIPSKESYSSYKELLSDAKRSNFNMIRVWGGGYYLPDYFYDICDEIGILVWQDLMFACAQYPTTDWFFQEIKDELEYQILRLQSHPSISLWCGDNEVWTTINWSDGTKDKKEFYRKEYKALNKYIAEIIKNLDNSRIFWNASPSAGNNDYMDKFVSENSGDFHFWEVWHGNSDFSGFLKAFPRFCSEFGFQSWPSIFTVESFAPQDEWNISSPSFECHQKNKAGNSKIQKMIHHYFGSPLSFQEELFLSQVQQAMAISIGVQHWRRNKNICSGTLFWQLNDCWPVSSWSSIEYGGRWKQLMYHSTRFFAPELLSFSHNGSHIQLFYINDKISSQQLSIEIMWIDWKGLKIQEFKILEIDGKPNASSKIWELEVSSDFLAKGFFFAFSNNGIRSEPFFIEKFKDLKLIKPKITCEIEHKNPSGSEICLSSDVPAFFVTLESKNVKKFSDNSFLLLPCEKKQVTCDEYVTKESLSIYMILPKNDL